MVQIKSNKIFTLFSILVTTLLFTISIKTQPNKYGWDEDKMYIDFDTSMETRKYLKAIAITKKITEVDGVDLLNLFRDLYEKNNLSKITPSEELKIPKIIHVVWINGKIEDCSIPQVLKKYVVTWIENYLSRGWKFKLWTDADVAKIKLDNQDLYDDSTNYGVKSDILKYEIIYRYGGVYVDTDFESLKPLDHLHYCYDFYVGIQPLDTQYLQLGAALFGARPGHPILKHVIDTMHKSYHSHEGAPDKTGPIHFTRAFFDIAGTTNTIDVAFPASYFYPFGGFEKYADREKWKNLGAFAIHWWGKTWMPSKYRAGRFKKIDNDELAKDWNK